MTQSKSKSMIKPSGVLLCAAFVAAAGAVFAPTALAAGGGGATPVDTPRFDQRQARQQARIAQGVEEGSLTRREARRLVAEQRRIGVAEHRAEADGVVSARERARLAHRQQLASRHIAQQKHDRQTAPHYDGPAL